MLFVKKIQVAVTNDIDVEIQHLVGPAARSHDFMVAEYAKVTPAVNPTATVASMPHTYAVRRETIYLHLRPRAEQTSVKIIVLS